MTKEAHEAAEAARLAGLEARGPDEAKEISEAERAVLTRERTFDSMREDD